MPKPKPLTHGFIVTGEANSGFSHVSLYLMAVRYDRQMRELFSLTWQSNHDTRHDFYGLRLVVNASAFDGPLPETAARINVLLRRLDGHLGTPGEVIARLLTLRIPRVAHEGRLHHYILESEQLPSDHRRYMDDYIKLGTGSCTRAVVAPDQLAAQIAMSARWAADLAAHPHAGDGEKFTNWIKAGLPVMLDALARPAVFAPLATLLHTPATLALAA